MNTIEFGAHVENKKSASFVALYALDGKPWTQYPGISSESANTIVPTVLMLHRFDGTTGFVGGLVDPGESIDEAVRRETREEVNFNLVGQLTPLVSHEFSTVAHLFSMEVPFETLRTIQHLALDAPHAGSEIVGTSLVHLYEYKLGGKYRGLSNFLQGRFAPSVREELVHFLLIKDIFERSALSEICVRAGYNLNELLK